MTDKLNLDQDFKKDFNNVKDNLKQKASSASDAVYDAVDDARKRFSDAEKCVEDYAHANPWKTIGFAMLAGVIVSQIMHIRK